MLEVERREGRGGGRWKERGGRKEGGRDFSTSQIPPGAAQPLAEVAERERKSSQEIKPTLGIKNKCHPAPDKELICAKARIVTC